MLNFQKVKDHLKYNLGEEGPYKHQKLLNQFNHKYIIKDLPKDSIFM